MGPHSESRNTMQGDHEHSHVHTHEHVHQHKHPHDHSGDAMAHVHELSGGHGPYDHTRATRLQFTIIVIDGTKEFCGFTDLLTAATSHPVLLKEENSWLVH